MGDSGESTFLWLAKLVFNLFSAGRAVERCHSIIRSPVLNLSLFLFSKLKQGMELSIQSKLCVTIYGA